MYFGIGHPEFGLFPSHWGRQAGCETFAVLTGSSGSVVGRIDAGLTQPSECAAPGLDPCRAVPTLVIEGVVSTGHHRCGCASTRSSSPPTKNTSCRPSSSASRSGRSSCTGWPPAAPRAITASTTTTSGASTWRADPIPSWLEPLRARCAALLGVRPRGAPGGAGPALPARRRDRLAPGRAVLRPGRRRLARRRRPPAVSPRLDHLLDDVGDPFAPGGRPTCWTARRAPGGSTRSPGRRRSATRSPSGR